MDFTLRDIEAICRSKALQAPLAKAVKWAKLPSSAPRDLTYEQLAGLWDCCMDVLKNDSPCVYSRVRRVDGEEYGFNIRGVPGAYFVEAIELDDDGPYPTRKDALAALRAYFV